MQTAVSLAVFATLGLAASGAPASDWQVRAAPAMAIPRAAHQATMLTTGEVLLTGGCSGHGCASVERSAEVYDPARGRSTPVAPMRLPRVAHVAVRLADGRVLVAGGWTGTSTTASAEVFDAGNGSFSAAAALHTARMDTAAAALPDGSVLVVGGASATNQPVAQAEIFSFREMAFRPAAALLEARARHAAVPLGDGRVLVTGGLRARNVASRTAEIYDPRNDRFEATGAMLQPRCKHAAVALKDGRVMVIGGSTDCGDRHRIAATEIYDPATGSFSAGPALQNPRYKIASAAAVLPGGEVVIAGDADDVELWVPGARNFVPVRGGIGLGLAFSAATVLTDGEVLVTGGYDDAIRPQAGAWRLGRRPAGAGRP